MTDPTVAPQTDPLTSSDSVLVNPSSHNFSKSILIGILIFALLLATSYGAYWYSQSVMTANVVPSTSSFGNVPSPKFVPVSVDETANWKALELRGLKLKVPLTWWYKEGKNLSYPIWWIDLNPTSVADPYDVMPLFQLRVDTNKATLEQFKQERIQTYYLREIKEEKRVISGNEWIILTAVVRPGPEIKNPESYTGRFKVGAKVKFALFVKGDDDYQLLGDVENNENIFNQILSTFKFL